MRRIGPIETTFVSGDGEEYTCPVPNLDFSPFSDVRMLGRPTGWSYQQVKAAIIDGSIWSVYGPWSGCAWGSWERTPEGWYFLADDTHDARVVSWMPQHLTRTFGFASEIAKQSQWLALEGLASSVELDDHIFAVRYGKSRYAGGHTHYTQEQSCALCANTEPVVLALS